SHSSQNFGTTFSLEHLQTAKHPRHQIVTTLAFDRTGRRRFLDGFPIMASMENGSLSSFKAVHIKREPGTEPLFTYKKAPTSHPISKSSLSTPAQIKSESSDAPSSSQGNSQPPKLYHTLTACTRCRSVSRTLQTVSQGSLLNLCAAQDPMRCRSSTLWPLRTQWIPL